MRLNRLFKVEVKIRKRKRKIFGDRQRQRTKRRMTGRFWNFVRYSRIGGAE